MLVAIQRIRLLFELQHSMYVFPEVTGRAGLGMVSPGDLLERGQLDAKKRSITSQMADDTLEGGSLRNLNLREKVEPVKRAKNETNPVRARHQKGQAE